MWQSGVQQDHLDGGWCLVMDCIHRGSRSLNYCYGLVQGGCYLDKVGIDGKSFHHYMMMMRPLGVDRHWKKKWWYGGDGVG